MIRNIRLPFIVDQRRTKISSSLDEDAWATYGGRLMLFANQATPDSSDDNYDIDFTECTWADPIPLLSVLLHANHMVRNGRQVSVRICALDAVTKTNNFPVFFFRHGFSEAARSVGIRIIDMSGGDITSAKESEYIDKKHVLAYPDPPVIKARIVNIRNEEQSRIPIRSVVDELVDNVRDAYEDLAHRSVFTGLLYRSQVILEETVQNVVDHAYPRSLYTPSFGVFARYRRGAKGIDAVEVRDWRRSVEREVAHCPFLKEDYVDDKEGFVEFFIIDHGIGIARSFENSGRPLDERRAIRGLLKRIFTVGESTKTRKRADAGGLTVIHNQMIPSRDYLRGYDSGVWFGVPGGLHRPNQTIDDSAPDKGATLTDGLAWTFRLGLRGEDAPALLWPRPGNDCRQRALDAFNVTIAPEEDVKGCLMVDSRINAANLSALPQMTGGGVVVWLPQSDLGKDDVRRFFGRIVGKLSNYDSWTVVIGDIRTHEGTVFYDALSGRTTLSDKHVKRICLATERMQMRLLTRVEKDGKGRYDTTKEQDDLLSGEKLLHGIGVPDIVQILRRHDSRIFWRQAEVTPNTYTPEWIKWGCNENGVEQFIFGYLNFEVLQRSSVVKQLARVGLERLIGLQITEGPALVTPADALVSDLCENFNSIGDRYKHVDAKSLLLGSICVTGATVDSVSLRGRWDAIHLLQHRWVFPVDDKVATKTVFLWKGESKANVFSSDPHKAKYERVGKSHSISGKGRNHYVIRKKRDGKYYAARTPAQFYEDIQRVRASTVRVGHWVYRNNHDVLGLNMRLFVRDAFDRLNDLAWFLIKALLIESGVPQSYFRPEIAAKVLKHGEFVNDEGKKGTSLVVFPCHPVTEKSIERLMNVLTPQGREWVRGRFIAVRRLRAMHKHMVSLLSPQSEEAIAGAVERYKPCSIVIFDDGMVSGNTYRDLRNLVADIVGLSVRRVVIVNRLREPGIGLETMGTNQYWRLDLPRLGNRESCTLCKALGEMKAFRERDVSSERARERLGEWIDAWRGVDPNREWSGTGLRPIALKEDKSFRMGRSGKEAAGDGETVRIGWSTALAVFDAELTTMTGLDDHIERLIQKVSPVDSAVEIELLTTHLLLFARDLSLQHRMRLSLRLLGLLADMEIEDGRSALACLLLAEEVSKYGEDFQQNVIDLVSEKYGTLGDVCFDVTLLFAFLIKQGVLDDPRFFRSARLLNTPRRALGQAYNDLYFETRGPLGNPHILPLQELADGRVSAKGYPRVQAGALDQVDKIINLLSMLDVRDARPPMLAGTEDEEREARGVDIPGERVSRRFLPSQRESVVKDIEEKLFENRLSVLIENLKGMKAKIKRDVAGHSFSADAGQLMQEQGLKMCQRIMAELDEFRRLFFFLEFSRRAIKRGEFEESFIDAIYESIKWDAAVEAKRREGHEFERPRVESSLVVDKNIPADMNISIICDATVVGVFKGLLLNAGYAKPSGDGESPVVCVECGFYEDRVEISLKNACFQSVAGVIRAANRKRRWQSLLEIGGGVKFQSGPGDQLVVTMVIPYAGYCKEAEQC